MDKTWVFLVVEEEEKDFIQLVRIVFLDAIDNRSHFMSVGLFVDKRIDDDVRSDPAKPQSSEGVDSSAMFKGVVVDETIDEKEIGRIIVFENAHDGVDVVPCNWFVVFRHSSYKLEKTSGGFFWTAKFQRFDKIVRRNRRESL